MPKISDTQRAVLVKIKHGGFILYDQNWKDYHEWWGSFVAGGILGNITERVPTFLILHLIKLGFIKSIEGYNTLYKITPLGLQAIGKDK